MNTAKRVLLLAVPETAGSVLYGLLDVLSATGNIWETLVRTDVQPVMFETQILALAKKPFVCGNGIPVRPDVSVGENPQADILVLPELWLGPDEHLGGRYPKLMDFIRSKHREGTFIYSACSGAVMLAESGLLDGHAATSHWGYQDLFRNHYPKVAFQPEPNLCFADEIGQVVTAGGTTSWHDLAAHIIARHASPGEALRIMKVYLLKWHSEGQLPYASLIRNAPHEDSQVVEAEQWLTEHFRASEPVSQLIASIGLPERTLKRRFKQACGCTLIERVQDLRVEEAKRLLEKERHSIDDISASVGYEDAAFFRRLFKRKTGVTPSAYRRMFKPIDSDRVAQLQP
ncbi:MAG: GlxA family transcriptional regulator [Pseudomonadales bacterium]